MAEERPVVLLIEMRVEIQSLSGVFDTASQPWGTLSALMSAAEDEGEVSPSPPAPTVSQQQEDGLNEWHSGVDRCQVVRLPDDLWERQSMSPRRRPPPSVSTENSALPPASPVRNHPISRDGGSESRQLDSPPISPEQSER